MSRGEKIGLPGLLLLARCCALAACRTICTRATSTTRTPKQIRAVQQYYNGRYFQHLGVWAIDGYPLFHAHLVEYALRVVEPVRRGLLQVVGVPPAKDALLDTMLLYWFLLTMNATFSTLTILLVFKVGKEPLQPRGCLGRGRVPDGVTDRRDGRPPGHRGRDGGFFRGAFAVLRVADPPPRAAARLRAGGGARVLRLRGEILRGHGVFPDPGRASGAHRPSAAWLGAASLWRLAVIAAAAVAGLFLAIPGLFGHFQDQLHDIVTAMTRSGQRVPKVLGKHAPRWEIMLHGQLVNLPPLIRILSPAAAAALLVGFATRVRRDPRFWILLVGPSAYWVFGVGSRAQIQPVFHAVMTAPSSC